MTLLFRSIQCFLRSLFRNKITDINEITEHSFRVLPTDLDSYMHMNHARYFNYLEAVRWDLQIRSGFLRLALKNGWIGPLASVQMDFYRPLTLFQKFSITTQFVAFEEKRLYMVQRMWSGKKEMARALIVSTIRKGRQNIPPEDYLAPLGFKLEEIQIPGEIKEWVSSRIG